MRAFRWRSTTPGRTKRWRRPGGEHARLHDHAGDDRRWRRFNGDVTNLAVVSVEKTTNALEFAQIECENRGHLSLVGLS